MKTGERLKFAASLLLVVVGTGLLGGLVYHTTSTVLRDAYRQVLDRSVAQGAFLVDSYLEDQFALLALYASVSQVQEGTFSALPAWLRNPEGTLNPKRFSILDAKGDGHTTAGVAFSAGDRAYFKAARAGRRVVEGPMVSRIDGTAVVVLAQPIPGGHENAAVLTASIDVAVFRSLLGSLLGPTVVLRLVGPLGPVAGTGSAQGATASVETVSRTLSAAPWSLAAEFQVDAVLEPVRGVLWLVTALVAAAMGALVVLVLSSRRHRLALESSYARIRQLAFHDPVTDLPNRNQVLDHLAGLFSGGHERRVIVIALARFRQLTTTFGMAFGDALLQNAAERLARFTAEGPDGFLGRVGGSEFVVVLAESRYSPSTLTRLIELFREPMGRDDFRLRVNVHVGACRLPGGGPTPEAVIKSAETALWAARAKGPNEASELTVEAAKIQARRGVLQRHLEAALGQAELSVAFQPQVEVTSQAIVGYEALLRWTNAELGPVAPSEFIPVAEETGLIVPLGDWVLDRAIDFALALSPGSGPTVSVNVSAVQLLQDGFLDRFCDRVSASGLPCSRIVLEITESSLMEGLGSLRPALTRLMERGMPVSLDDFGTGYSSLTYLKELPLAEIKIDKGFIDGLTDQKGYHLIESIIDLAHRLGLVVVAEGIESQEQHDLVARVSCDRIQGYLTGRPQPAEAFLKGTR